MTKKQILIGIESKNHLKHLNKTDHIVGEVSPEEVAPNEGDRDILKSLLT